MKLVLEMQRPRGILNTVFDTSEKAMRRKVQRSLSVALSAILAISYSTVMVSPAMAVAAEVVNVDFRTAAVAGSTITNGASSKIADLTSVGSPEQGSTGMTFANSLSAPSQYLTGNLGSTASMTKIVIEMTAKFPDAGCSSQSSGSMVFGLGNASGSYVSYNIYRHSNFIGFNTFSSEVFGIVIPDNTAFHTYKFVMVPDPILGNLQEIWVDDVKQTLGFKTSPTSVGDCSGLGGTGESAAARVFKNSGYTNGDFMLMTHPLGATAWETAGTLQSVSITTTSDPVTNIAWAPSSLTASASAGSLTPSSGATTNSTGAVSYAVNSAGTTGCSVNSSTGEIGFTAAGACVVRATVAAAAPYASAFIDKTFTITAALTYAPSAPMDASAAGSDASATVTWNAPSSNGGAAITGYTVTASPGGATCAATAPVTTCLVLGLTNDTAYTFAVTATNSAGTSSASISSSAVTPTAPVAPPAPIINNVTPPEPVAPVLPPVKVSSVQLVSGEKPGRSVVKVKLAEPQSAVIKSDLRVRIYDFAGQLIKELMIPVTASAATLELEVDLPVGHFNVEAAAVNSAGVSEAVAAAATIVNRPLFKDVPTSKAPSLSGSIASKPILFAPNSATLSAAAKSSLISLVENLKNSSSRIALTGFTARWVKGRTAEVRLAAKRSLAVAEFLKAQGLTNWIYYAGYGSVAGTESKASARKVELRILR